MTVEDSSRLTRSMFCIMAPCRSCVRHEYPGRQWSGSDLPRGGACKGLLQSAGCFPAKKTQQTSTHHSQTDRSIYTQLYWWWAKTPRCRAVEVVYVAASISAA
jgi:hypothetical protein